MGREGFELWKILPFRIKRWIEEVEERRKGREGVFVSKRMMGKRKFEGVLISKFKDGRSGGN